MVDGVGGDDDAGPDESEEVVDADDLAGAVGEAEEEEHGAGFEAGGFGLG